jgi:predicted deacylase
MAGKTTELVRRMHQTGEELTIPVAWIEGARPGPTFAITSGMHAGEYAGVFAASQLIQELDPAHLAGRVIVIPVISTRAFMLRSMQLSPVDEKEVHFQLPGNPEGTYSELLIDVLYGLVRDADYLIDMHSGEFAQSLAPWVPVPYAGSETMCRRALQLARGFEVPYLDLRTDASTIPAFARFLDERGIANVWTEIGQNGLPDPEAIRLQYEGCRRALQAVGCLDGPAAPSFRHRYIGQRHHTVVAEQSGIWYSAVRAGEIVAEGQPLGELRDYFGNVLARYTAPFPGIVLYFWSSPAINAERRPHGYNWHSALVRLAGLPTDEPASPAP